MSEISEKTKLLRSIAAMVEEMRNKMATKDDIARLETKLATVQGNIEQIQLPLDNIEKNLTTRLDQIEAEVSRLRSVVYLLVKDKPELLRLLG